VHRFGRGTFVQCEIPPCLERAAATRLMTESLPQGLITVAMPVYNAGEHLRAAVLSILKQSYTNWEFLILDDGSTDGALESISDLSDPRINLRRDGRNVGAAARLNEAIDLARGQYLARMDQDDISYPGRFASQVARLSRDPSLDLVAVRAIKISARNELVGFFPSPLRHAEICSRPWRGFYLAHPTWMGRIEWFRKYRYGIPESYLSDDQELLLRSYRESTFACVDEIQFAYRIRDRIRLKKHLRIHWTVMSFQVATFTRRRQFGFALRSAVIYCLRVGRDAWRSLTQALALRPAARIPRGEGEAAIGEWERLKGTLLERHC